METLLKIGEALKVVGEVTFAIIMWFVVAAFITAVMTVTSEVIIRILGY